MDKAIQLATAIYYHFYFRPMLTMEEESLYNQAIDVLDEAGMLDKNGDLIEE